MKLLQMLKLTKLRKLLSRKPKEDEKIAQENLENVDEAIRQGKIEHFLKQMIADHREESGALNMNPIPSFKGMGVSLTQLASFPPTQVRNIKKCFARSIDDFARWRGGYSDQTLESLLIERGGDTVYGSVCRKADPTVLITKRPGYERKVDGKYSVHSTPIIPSVANGRVVVS